MAVCIFHDVTIYFFGNSLVLRQLASSLWCYQTYCLKHLCIGSDYIIHCSPKISFKKAQLILIRSVFVNALQIDTKNSSYLRTQSILLLFIYNVFANSSNSRVFVNGWSINLSFSNETASEIERVHLQFVVWTWTRS